MFAVVRTGGKQYKVQPGDVVAVEKLEGKVGDVISLDDVLFLDDKKSQKIDDKELQSVAVEAEILEQKKDKKVIIFKKIRRHNYRRKKGHRQEVSVLRIKDILADGKKSSAKKAAPKKQEATEEKPKKAAPKKEASAKKETKAAPKKATAEKKTAPKKTAAKKTTTKDK